MADNSNDKKSSGKSSIGISPKGYPYRVMLIEDSRSVRIVLKQILLSAEFSVIAEAENGREAVLKVTNQKIDPDIIIIDYEMPVMNGSEAIREIKPLLPHCRILMVTSVSSKAVVEEIASLGIDGYLVKPVQRDLLLKKMSAILEKQYK